MILTPHSRGHYLCVVGDVETDVFTVADIAVLNRGTRPLTADAHG